MDRGNWQATVYRISKSWTRRKRRSMHTHISSKQAPVSPHTSQLTRFMLHQLDITRKATKWNRTKYFFFHVPIPLCSQPLSQCVIENNGCVISSQTDAKPTLVQDNDSVISTSPASRAVTGAGYNINKCLLCSVNQRETDILMIETCPVIEIILCFHEWQAAKHSLQIYLLCICQKHIPLLMAYESVQQKIMITDYNT